MQDLELSLRILRSECTASPGGGAHVAGIGVHSGQAQSRALAAAGHEDRDVWLLEGWRVEPRAAHAERRSISIDSLAVQQGGNDPQSRFEQHGPLFGRRVHKTHLLKFPLHVSTAKPENHATS